METLRIDITGSDPDSDAPSVDDLVGQLSNVLDLLREVERAVALPGEQDELVWRVVNATRKSPLAVEIAAYPKRFGTNITRREKAVRETTSRGLAQLRNTGERPTYFSDVALKKAEGLFERVLQGLGETRLEFSGGLPQLDITRAVAAAATENMLRAAKPADKPYRELGSIEGFLSKIEKDGWGRPILWFRARITDDTVKCVLKSRALQEVRRLTAGSVIDGERALITGVLYYKGIGRLASVDAEDLYIYAADQAVKLSDIVDPNFTGGVRSEDYLEELRRAEHS